MQYEVLERGLNTQRALDDAERKWISHYNSQYPNGYNVKPGGQGGNGLINGMTPQQAFAKMNGKGGGLLSTIGTVLSSPLVGDIINASMQKAAKNNGANIDKFNPDKNGTPFGRR